MAKRGRGLGLAWPSVVEHGGFRNVGLMVIGNINEFLNKSNK